MPAKKDEPDIPSTLLRSAKKVQDTYEKTLEAAEETYDGDEERAHRTAWSAVKHVAEKKGDHWELKDEKGPSDPPGAESETHGGIDASKTKAQLMDDARAAGIEGRSKMDKDQLVDALEKHSRRETAKARG
jgi:cation transport regulator ChaB